MHSSFSLPFLQALLREVAVSFSFVAPCCCGGWIASNIRLFFFLGRWWARPNREWPDRRHLSRTLSKFEKAQNCKIYICFLFLCSVTSNLLVENVLRKLCGLSEGVLFLLVELRLYWGFISSWVLYIVESY